MIESNNHNIFYNLALEEYLCGLANILRQDFFMLWQNEPSVIVGRFQDICSEVNLKLMAEGGPHVLTSFMRENLADSLSLFIAPKIIGSGLGLGEGINLNSMREAFNLKNIKTQNFSNGDILLEGVF